MRELSLSRYVVRVRQVPAYALTLIAGNTRLPEPPTVEVKTVAGTETVRARPGMPEYDEYQSQVAAMMETVARRQTWFAISYGVYQWKTKDGEWQSEPPPDWELDPMIATIGGDTGDRRLNFILYEVLADPGDLTAVSQAVSGIREEDIEAAEALFRR